MNKVELVASVAEKTGLAKKDAEKAVSAVLESIVNAVAGGDKVQLVGFGTFEVRERGERTRPESPHQGSHCHSRFQAACL